MEMKSKFDGSKGSDDYDPYKHRTVLHPTTNWETFFHLMKGSLGKHQKICQTNENIPFCVFLLFELKFNQILTANNTNKSKLKLN